MSKMSDSDSDERINIRHPPPLISKPGATQFAQPATFPLVNQQLPPGYVVLPQGAPQMQVIQGLDGTLYAIHSPGITQQAAPAVLPVRSPVDTTTQSIKPSLPAGIITPALATGSQNVPLVPIYAPIPVAPSIAKKYQQMIQLPNIGTESAAISPHTTSPKEVSSLGPTVPSLNYSTSVIKEDSLQSPVMLSPHRIHSPKQKEPETSSKHSSRYNSTALLSPKNYHVQSPTLTSSFMEGLSSVQRASILQQHRRSLYVQDKDTQEYVVSEESLSSGGSSSSKIITISQKDMKTSSLKKLLQSEPETTSSSTVAESHSDTTYSLLKNEPYLVRFYQFFQSSDQAEHLRMRVLTTEGSSNILKWIEVTRKASHIDPNFGPLDAVRILISSNGLCKLQVLFPFCKTLFTRFMPSSLLQANELFNELSPRHVLCPGIPECESKLAALGYHPGSVRMIETPSMRRFDHEKCPLWHIPLPCNLYSESGQIMHHMCRQCKNLHNTLTRTVAKICHFSTSDSLSAVPSHSDLSSKHESTREGQLKPPRVKRQKRKASLVTTGLSTTDSATEQTTQQNETTSHHDIEYYSDSQSREKSESVTTRHSDQDDTTETSVVVISASNASTMRLTSDSAEKMTTPHTVTDAAGISRYYPANRVSMSEDQTRVELLRKQKREKPSLEDQSSNCGLELTSLRKHKDMSLESHDTTKKQKISSESASNSELHIDCDCGADQNL